MTRVLIATMYSGENDYPYCVRSVERQTHCAFEHRVISGLGNVEAHRTLYELFRAERAHFTHFLKLDADMVFRTDAALNTMVHEMNRIPDCDHATWHVLDFLSETKLRGVHMFTSRAEWRGLGTSVFVDPNPEIPGARHEFSKRSHSHVLHCAFPSERQAFEFGVHRGTKCFTPKLDGSGWGMRYFQFKLLCAVWRMFVQTKDHLRGLAMLGAEWARVRQGAIPDYRTDPDAHAWLETAQDFDFEETYARCAPYWSRRRTVEFTRHWIAAKFADRVRPRLGLPSAVSAGRPA